MMHFRNWPSARSTPKRLEEVAMLKFILSVALATALSSTAFAQSVSEQTGVNSALGIAPKITEQKGNADEKQFAQQMITDHTRTSSELKGLVPADKKSALPTALDDSSQKKLDKLRDTKPEDFAGQYDPMQVSAHKDAVSLFERYAKGGEGPKLKD